MITLLVKHKLFISIFIIWLFHISAIIGISLGFENWFISLTPLNLLICFATIIWIEFDLNKKNLWALTIPFGIGFMAEYLGVNYGLLFGQYSYGKNLGYKFQEVPIIIGINWAILIYASSLLGQYISKNKIVIALIASMMMVGLDLVMEKCAPRFDFWEFENQLVPIQNYVGWFLVSFIAHLVFLRYFRSSQTQFAFHLLLAFSLFFIIFAMQIL